MTSIERKRLDNFIKGLEAWENNSRVLQEQIPEEEAPLCNLYATQNNVLKSIINSLEFNKLRTS